ncbi:helix-turn-helix domain-containing protein [Streptomyces sp. 8N706]|uniref:helix-turn-helix domain-containing protein n=1 Tax=Streptomyces sp. 8N706 TaxID=3457416 RepID=UPI003FD0940C
MLTPEKSPQHRLGYLIRELRRVRGMSMRGLAAKTFVSHSTVQRWENGERPPKERVEAELIDRVLGAGGLLIELWQEIGRHVSDPGHVSDPAAHVSQKSRDLATAASQKAASDSEGIFVPARLDDGTVALVALDRRALLRGGVGIGATAVADLSAPTAAMITASEDPFGFARSVTENCSFRLSRPVPDYGVDWQALIPGSRTMLGKVLGLAFRQRSLNQRRHGRLWRLRAPRWGSIVSATLINKSDGPHYLDLRQVEWGPLAGGPCRRGPKAYRPPFVATRKVIDVDQGTRTPPHTHSTPPWGQRRMRERWPVGGVFAFIPAVPVPAMRRASGAEGVGMT